MPNVTIAINDPVLTAGQKFKTRYRLLPAGAWSAYTDRTNAPFVLALAVGEYELEVILVKADETECPATIKKFKVVDPFTCRDFAAEIVEQNGLFYVQLSYGGGADPACGWTINYGGTVVNYAVLPASPIKLGPVPNAAINVFVIANNCQGNTRECFNDDLEPIDAPCTPMVINSTTIKLNGFYPNGNPNFLISHNYVASIPCSQTVILNVQQLNVISGAPGSLSVPAYPISCVSGGFGYGIQANQNVQWVISGGVEKKRYEFFGTIVDICGTTHQFNVQIDV